MIKLAIELYKINVKSDDDNNVFIETVINITDDDIGYTPVFNYCIDDTYISRDGYADESTDGLVILSDILQLKLCNKFPPRVYIEVADISKVVDLKDYVNPKSLDSHFELNKVLVIL